MRKASGTTFTAISREIVQQELIPLPPLAEQKRIVAKIEELLPHVEQYGKAHDELTALNEKFPDAMKKSILQYAMEGKLVEQREEEGTAKELLAAIKAEKARLVVEGKLKKEKPLPEIKAEEIPFEIPESWEWVRLCDLGWFSSGKTPAMHEPKNWQNGTIPWITSKDMKAKYLVDSQMKITEQARQGMTTYPAGTLLFVVRSGILKRTLPICILTMESTINQDIKAYTLFNNTMSDYLYYMLKGLEPHILLNYTKRVTTVDSLKFDEFSREMPVPLPPLAEQKRIVAKIEELLACCEALEK